MPAPAPTGSRTARRGNWSAACGTHGSAFEGLAAFGLVILFGFAFEWLFITLGLFAGNAQAARGMGMIVFPFAFVSSAYVPVSSMPGWLQAFAKHQPLTQMVDVVRSLTLGPQAHALLGHSTGYFVTRALLWAAGSSPSRCRSRWRSTGGGSSRAPRSLGRGGRGKGLSRRDACAIVGPWRSESASS